MKTQKIKIVRQGNCKVRKCSFFSIFQIKIAIVAIILNVILFLLFACSQKSSWKINNPQENQQIEVRDVQINIKEIAEIPVPPEPEDVEIEQEIEIVRPDTTVEDTEIVVENVAVDAPTSDIVMPTILKVKPTNSALIMPSLFRMRSGSGRKACLKRYGGSVRKIYYRRLPVYGQPPVSNDKYSSSFSNIFRMTTENPLSTVSIDVDTASYSNTRRYLKDGLLPPSAAVRVEDFINYFKYDYPEPESGENFSLTAECAPCPWNTDNQLLLIGLKGREMIKEKKKVSSNYVFLIDVSGSMSSHNKLPLLKRSLNLMIDKLSKNDRIAIVTYASNTRVLMDAVSGKNKISIRKAVDSLSAGGCTYGESGIKLAYRVAEENFIKGGNNRVILATDGDFNVGVTDNKELKELVIKKKKSGVFLTVIGMGSGNLNDSMMETISNHGNGNYFYIDSFKEARKVFTTDLDKNLFTIAKDVKIQVEFNPVFVAEYRLIGYENRVMKKRTSITIKKMQERSVADIL
jgi:uncharacterized protein YegL